MWNHSPRRYRVTNWPLHLGERERLPAEAEGGWGVGGGGQSLAPCQLPGCFGSIRLCRSACSQPNDAIFSDSLGSHYDASTSKKRWEGQRRFPDIKSYLHEFPGSREGTKWQQTDSQMRANRGCSLCSQPLLSTPLQCRHAHSVLGTDGNAKSSAPPCPPWA